MFSPSFSKQMARIVQHFHRFNHFGFNTPQAVAGFVDGACAEAYIF
jgi:hypothetical protein